MKPEIWISIYAAILATSALALNVRTWFDAGVRLKLSVIADGIVFGGDPQFDEKDLVLVTVTNRGRTVTVISNLLLYEFASKWKVRRNRPSKTYGPKSSIEGLPVKRSHGASAFEDLDGRDMRWSRFPGQFGGKAKMDSGFDYAASFSSFSCIA